MEVSLITKLKANIVKLMLKSESLPQSYSKIIDIIANKICANQCIGQLFKELNLMQVYFNFYKGQLKNSQADQDNLRDCDQMRFIFHQ